MSGSDEPRITVADVRAAGHCVSGAKRWFEQHGLDFRAFVRDGIVVSDVEKIDDAFSARIVDAVRERDGRR